ncbi:MAG: MG2 domain-containing protein, partial [Flavobacteriales bacterium]
LKTPQLKEYEAILTGTDRFRNIRPSLYHLLLSRALNFYSSDERNLINFDPTTAYQEAGLLSDLDSFLAIKSKPTVGLEPAGQTIFMYQELLREAKNVSTESVVLEDLKRLEFMHKRSSLASKDKLYEAQLNALLKHHTEAEVSAEIAYQLAGLYQQQGSVVSDVSHSDYWKWKSADSLCQVYIKKFPNSVGARNCKSLSERIRSKEWGMDAEGIILPNKAFRILLRYRNLDTQEADKWPVYARVASIDPIEYRNNARQNYGEKLIRWLKSHSTTVAEKTFEIPNPKDFKSHSIELPLEGLSAGTYVVFVGTNAKLSTNADAVSFAIIIVSDLAIIKRQNDNGKSTIKVLSRDLGDPISEAKIELLNLVYNRNNRKNTYELVETLITDKNGEATWLAKTQNHRGLIADVYHEQDKLISADNIYGYGRKEDIRWNERSHFFLDRAIYRPGQTIQFKGLMLRSNGSEVETLRDKTTTVKLYDANGQEVSKLGLKSNEFGTFSGTFIAPTGGLNGQIRIGNETGSRSFRLEEYKRPKFEVKVENPTGQYQVNDTVSVSGSAISYSGVPLDGAEVKYRVTRTTSFPYRWLCWGWFPQSNPKQVAFGTAVSDASGQFNIVFQAQPDPLVQSKYKPVFQYKVEVDVTDQSGEMQTGNGNISVGYHALNLGINVPGTIEKNELGTYTISATNLSGEKQDAKVSVDVWELKQNNRILRNRMWTKPDQFYLSEIDHKRQLVNEPYAQETDFKTWEKNKNMYHGIVDTEKGTDVNIGPLKSLPQGYYLVELTATDAFGTEVKQRAYYNMVDVESASLPYVSTDWFYALKDSYEPGETLEFLVG